MIRVNGQRSEMLETHQKTMKTSWRVMLGMIENEKTMMTAERANKSEWKSGTNEGEREREREITWIKGR
jgi:hypothetical protein